MSHWTNINNLPAPFASAIMNDIYDRCGDISVSGLIESVRIHQLRQRYDDWIIEDVSDGIWRLLGSIGHAIVERADQHNHLAEERLTIPVNGWVISGKADLLDPDMKLSDYKYTSVYSFMFGEKPEWTAQLNLYARIYREQGFEVKAAQIVAALRDWKKREAKKKPDYPQFGVIVQPIEIWTPEQQEEYLLERVTAHQKGEETPEADLPMCTDTERWHQNDVWAVKKKGGKRAVPGGLHQSEEAAENFILTLKGPRKDYEIEHRVGEDVRCLDYCPVRQFCSHGKTLQDTAPAESEAA